VSNIHLLIGENDFTRQQELKRWKDEFMAKHGDINLMILSGDKLKLPELLDQISSPPFLGDKRLVVVETVPTFDKDDLDTIVNTLNEDSLLLFVDRKPDKRKGFVKQLLKNVTLHEFTPLKQPQLLSWANKQAAEFSITFAPNALKNLLAILSLNQSLIYHQLQLFAVTHSGVTITVDDITKCVLPLGGEAGWQLFDYITGNKRQQALEYLRTMEQFHENTHGLWSRFSWWCARVLWVQAMMSSGASDSKAIASKLGIHPFSMRSMTPLARRLDKQKAQIVATWLLQKEQGLKTGTIRATQEFPEELQAVLDQAVILLTD